MDQLDLYVPPKDRYYYLELALNFFFTICFVSMNFNEIMDISNEHIGTLIFSTILICILCFGIANIPAKIVILVIMIVESLFPLMKYVLSWIFKMMLSSNNSKRYLHCLVRCFLTEAEENIIGDLREEFSQFPSKPKACVWLSKQILISIPPLLYNNFRDRLASYFGERIR